MGEPDITLRWELAYRKRGRSSAERLLSLLQEQDRRFLPRRYGTREPLKCVVSKDDFSGFLAAWEQAKAEPYGGSVHFMTHLPFSWGSVSFSDPREVTPKGRVVGEKRVVVSVNVLGRTIANEKQAAKLERLFVAVARALGSYYAIAYLETGAVRRGRRYYSYTRYPLPRSGNWLGIPQVPGWLIWFGPPYAEPVRNCCQAHIAADFDDGFLMNRGVMPEGLEALKDGQPLYPPELTARLSEQTLSGQTHSIFPPSVTALDPRRSDGPAETLLSLV